jgi:hypothetical protein
MKKITLFLVLIGITFQINAQVFNSLTASGGNKKIEWTTSNWGSGFGHKIYSFDPGGKTLLNIAARHNNSSWTNLMTFTSNGKVGIGTDAPDAPLTVKGLIHSREVKVTATAGGADFVFENEYDLPSLEEVESYIKKNKHLPEIASAKDMEKDGIHLAEMNIKLLQKIEELTLYTIAQQKEIIEQKEKVKKLEEGNKVLKSLTMRLSKVEEQLKKKN